MTATARVPPTPPTGKPTRVLSFVQFCERMLDLHLTPAQRALARVVFDGEDPIDLSDEDERRLAREIFGAVDRISERARRRMVALRLGRWSGKTTMCAARVIYRMCTADLSRCGPGDIPLVAIIAPRRETGLAAMQIARHFSTSPKVRPWLVQSAQWGFTIKRPQDGREVQFKVVAKSQGGATVRGFSLVDVLIDEAEFVSSGGADAKVSDTDIVDACMPRLLPGGRVTFISTPNPGPSELGRIFDENFGTPRTGIAARASTPLMRDAANDPELAAAIADEVERKPQNARREFYCELIDGAGGAFFEVSAIARAMESPPSSTTKSKASSGIDPAFVNDSSAQAIVERRQGTTGPCLDLVHLDLRAPTREAPLVPSEVIRDFAAATRAHGSKALATDGHKFSIVAAHAAAVGVQTAKGPRFDETAVYLREVLREGKLRIGRGHPLAGAIEKQLKAVTYRARSGGGIHVEAPRSLEDGHADLVAALAMAVWFDGLQHGPLVRGALPSGGSSGAGGGTKPFGGMGVG